MIIGLMGAKEYSSFGNMNILLRYDKSGVEYTPPYRYLCKHREIT